MNQPSFVASQKTEITLEKVYSKNHEVNTKLRGFTFLISQNKVFFLTTADNSEFVL